MKPKKIKKTKSKKKIKIKYTRVFILLLVLLSFILGLAFIINLKITNIVVIGDYNILKEQEIIDIASISNYPKTLAFSSSKIKKNLEDNIYIKNAKVKKKYLTQVYIMVEENYPLFFYKTDNKTILLDGSKVDKVFSVPTVINYIPNLKYQSFVEKMGLLDSNILERISEIKYDPSDYDDERFLLYMKDGNYVYINLYKFSNLNKYIEIVKNFGNKRGIVYLDSGNYFEIIEK
ncbi:MAG: FtsQ-type POTRA domain-containing protein [Bacilli bacterium]|nr:FtsQ-type POTRA domain-containing protein [Bacilli bacterium]